MQLLSLAAVRKKAILERDDKLCERGFPGHRWCRSPLLLDLHQHLEELVGHVDRLQRSQLFTYFRLDQGPISFIYRPSAPRASRNQIDAFIAKRVLLIVLYRPWMDWRVGRLVSNL
jgi:hypothetical protein